MNLSRQSFPSDQVGSVLVKHYDYLLAPGTEDLDELGLRESMVFAKDLKRKGDEFIQKHFGDGIVYGRM